MSTLDENTNEQDDVIDAEFEITGGDIPLPAELAEGDSGSARYPLPDELVRVAYPEALIPTNQQAMTPTERVIIVAPVRSGGVYNDLAHYDAVFQKHERFLPLRVVGLRSLHGRLNEARTQLAELQKLPEMVRINLNLRNNLINLKIEEELSQLREQWLDSRNRHREEIRILEDALIQYRMERQKEVEEARRVYWATRERVAKLRDEEDREEKQRLRDEADEKKQEVRLARERATKLSEAYKAIQQELCTESRQKAEVSEVLAQKAEEELHRIENEAIARHEGVIEAAWQRCQEALAESAKQIEQQEAEYHHAALERAQELEHEKRERENRLHEVECDQANLRTTSEQDLKATQLKLAEAKSRFPVVATEEVIAEQTDTHHLAFESSNPFQQAMKILAHVGLGTIFGISLGLLTGLADLTDEGLRRTWGVMLAVCTLGVFIFYLMGKLAFRVTAYATEEFHAVSNPTAYEMRWMHLRPWFASFLAVAVIVGMIGLEACVEREGIVEAIIQRQMENGEEGVLNAAKELAYWALALVVSAPFLIYHAYEGAIKTRYRLGEKRRREQFEQKKFADANSPEVTNLQETEQRVLVHQALVEKLAQNEAHLLAEARRRIAEVEEIRENDPILRRWQEFLANRETLLEKNILVQEARLALAQAKQGLEEDSELLSARARAEQLRQTANEARALANSIESSLLATIREGAEKIIASFGTGGVQFSGDQAGAILDKGLGGVSNPSAGLMREALESLNPKLEGNSAALRRQFATWEETMAEQRWTNLRNSIQRDPQVRFYVNRIKSLKSLIHSEDTIYGKQRKRLIDQKRAVEVRFREISDSEDSKIHQALEQAEADVRALQAEFDEARELFIRVAGTPFLLRWIEELRQLLFVKTISAKRLAMIHSRSNQIEGSQPRKNG